MTWWEALAVVAAGLGAGVLGSTTGVASLVSFPVLLALGLPPVVANASNTIGMFPGALSGVIGFRAELREHPRVTAMILAACGLGAVGGAALLLALPPQAFESVVPWLILFTTGLVAVQPKLARLLRSRRQEPARMRHGMSPWTSLFAVLTGGYAGYFSAGSGVVMIAVLGLGTDLELRVVNALKTVAVLAATAVASVVFIAAAMLDWTVVGLLSAGSLVGGYVGARIGRRLAPNLLRGLVVVAGVMLAVLLML